MELKIVSDSSSDYLESKDIKIVPLKIRNDKHEFVDNSELDVVSMLETLREDGIRTSSSCPAIGEFEEAMEEGDNIVAIAISSKMSGSYNAARVAAESYEDKNILVCDSLSAGPGLAILIDKLLELKDECETFGELCDKFNAYKEKTRLVFVLESLQTFVNNGRVSPIVAKAANMFGIRIIARASKEGEFDVIGKKKGAKKAYNATIDEMLEQGYDGGKVVIHHCNNQDAADYISAKLIESYPTVEIEVRPTRGLCSYYAEDKGYLVSYEVK